jgi:hypothetical protein
VHRRHQLSQSPSNRFALILAHQIGERLKECDHYTTNFILRKYCFVVKSSGNLPSSTHNGSSKTLRRGGGGFVTLPVQGGKRATESLRKRRHTVRHETQAEERESGYSCNLTVPHRMLNNKKMHPGIKLT